MGTIKLLKDTLKNIRLKMISSDPGIHHPVDTETPTGEIADQLSKISIMIHLEETVNPETDKRIEYLFSILQNRNFKFDDQNYKMLWQINKSILEMRQDLNNKLNENGILNSQFEIDCRSMHVKGLVRESLVASISFQYDAKRL